MNVKVIGPSLVLDLSWCITKCQKREPTDWDTERTFDNLGGQRDRLNGFWDDGMAGFAEVEVLAYLADAIEVLDFASFQGRCNEALCSEAIELEVALMSETDQDQATILSRLRSLRDSVELRDSYFNLLGDIWSVVSPWWEKEGRESLNSATSEVLRKLSMGSSWHEILSMQCATFEKARPGIISRYEEGKPVKLAACAFFGKGLYFEFSDYILIGFGIETAVDSARNRVSSAIRPLRALADPTRLAIFEFLKSGPSTIKCVAESFSLSQPTVSVHVKHLREVGLVNAKRHGTQLAIDIDWAEADTISSALRAVLSQ